MSKSNSFFISPKKLGKLLNDKLPGEKAHKSMLPKGREISLPTIEFQAVESAVLVLLIEEDQELFICLIRRSSNLKNHAGQIGFPGGKKDSSDMNDSTTALREAKEEIGIDTKQVQVIGSLSPIYLQISNFQISPIVGWCKSTPLLECNPAEVDELLLIPLVHFLNSKNRSIKVVDSSTGKLNVPCFYINENVIWGATAMILAELITLLKPYCRFPEEDCNNDGKDQ